MKYLGLLDKEVQDVLSIDNHDPMVILGDNETNLQLDFSVDLGYENEFIVRETVAKMLSTAASYMPENVFLCVKETYRPLSFQRFIYNRRLILLFCNPEYKTLTSQEIRTIASEYIAPPEVAGHPTGGAVDVSLIDHNGNELDLGCAYDDDPVVSQGRCYSYFSELPQAVIRHRKMLFDCMQKAGFINYPFEWWHWSYGDKYWAASTGAKHAIYSAIDMN